MTAPIDFYGEPSYWFMIVTFVFGVDIVLTNLVLLWIAGTTPEIRSVLANFFVINLSLAHTLWGSLYVFVTPFVFIFGAQHPILCESCGFALIIFVQSFFSTAPLMAACRFYNISRMPNSSFNWFISHAFFKKMGTVTLLATFWSYGLLFATLLALFNQLGEDPSGFCAARAFTSTILYFTYNLALICVPLANANLTFIYYRRLQRFMAEHTRNKDDQRAKDTRAVMKMVAISATLPLFCYSRTLLMSGGQWFVPDLFPMWLKRLVLLLTFLPPMTDPWCTMLLLRSFRKKFEEKVVAKIWNHSITTSVVPVVNTPH